jgi:hypothetical protein
MRSSDLADASALYRLRRDSEKAGGGMTRRLNPALPVNQYQGVSDRAQYGSREHPFGFYVHLLRPTCRKGRPELECVHHHVDADPRSVPVGNLDN